jgi:hypothetical protein
MKILENITGGYKKIATGIAIVSILALMYIALIPGGTLAAVVNMQGVGIEGALVKIVEWPEYNATTAPDGTYAINSVPYGTYTIKASAYGYFPNTSTVTVDSANVPKNFILSVAEIYESVFLPILGSDYDSAIHIRNPQIVNASVIIDVYYSNGSLAGSSTYEIEPNASIAKFTNDIVGFKADGAYSARVTANVPIIMTSDIRSIPTSILSSVPGQRVPVSSTLNSAFILSDPVNNTDSAIHIRNPQNTTVTTTVELYNSDGTFKASKTYNNIDPNAMVADFTSTIIGNSNYFKGSVKFISTKPVVVTADVRSISTGVLASIPGQEIPVSLEQESVLLINGWGYESFVQIVNPQQVATDVNVSFYYTNGTLANKKQYTLQPNESRDINIKEYVGDSNQGSVNINSYMPIVEQSSVVTTSNKVYASVKGQTPNVILNGAWTINGYGYDSAIHIRNPQSTSANVTVYLLNNDGSLAGFKKYPVDPNGMAAYFTTDVLGNSNTFTGSVLFVGDKPVVVTNDIRAVGPGVLTSQPGIVG